MNSVNFTGNNISKENENENDDLELFEVILTGVKEGSPHFKLLSQVYFDLVSPMVETQTS